MHRYDHVPVLGRAALVASIGAIACIEPYAASTEPAIASVVAAQGAEIQRAANVHRVGFVSPTEPGPRNDAFLDGLRALGYVDGRNVSVEMRFAEGQPDRLPALIDELVHLNVDALVVGATIGARAAKAATASIPVVFAGSSDPLAGGIVTNLARPEANLTGTSLAIGERFAGKWLELLKELVPGTSRVAILWSSGNPAAVKFVDELRAAARALSVTIDVHHAAKPLELDSALELIGRSTADGLIVTPSPFAAANQEKLVRFAASQRLPAVYFVEDFVVAGGLMSYGPSIAESYRRAATYVDRILRAGAKPADLPVEQPTTFDLVLNSKTARTLGIDIPSSILLRARLVD